MIARLIGILFLASLSYGLLLPLASAATTDDGVFITNRSEIPIRLQRPGLDLATVERVDFWQTNDLGRSWLLVRQIEVDADTQLRDIRYRFRPRSDGRYGFRICLHYRDGTSDPEPRSGTAPANSDMIEIATQRPDIVRFNAVVDDADEHHLHLSWAIRTMHPGSSPGVLQWSADGSTWHDHSQSLGVHGTQQLPLDPQARWVRLRARDVAGNQRLSDPQRIAEDPTVEAEDEPDSELSLPDSLTPGQSTDAAAESSSEPSPQTVPISEVEERTEDEAEAAQTETAAPEQPAAETASETADSDARPLGLPSREELLAALQRQHDAEPAQGGDTINPADYLPRMPDVPEGHQDIVEPHKNRPARDDAPSAATTARPIDPQLPIVPPTPQDHEAILEQALRFMREKRLHEAQILFRRLRGTPVYARSLPREMETLRLLGRHDEALALFRAAPPQAMSDQAITARVRVLISLQRPQEALEDLARIADDSSQVHERTFLAAIALAQLGRNRQARATMDSIAHLDNYWGRAARAWLARQR